MASAIAVTEHQEERPGGSLGIYCSVPFCRAKCSFCNFSSDSFHPARMPAYIERLAEEIARVRADAAGLGACVPERVDTVYFGGGTPTLLAPKEIDRTFAALRAEFALAADAEITVEAAPGQIADQTLDALLGHGMNRLSFGVQSFDDGECAAVGRTHTAASCRTELQRVAAAGVPRLALDLIAGLPHSTAASWRSSIEQAIDTGVEHISVYMFELDEDSRLGREALGGGVRFGAGALPDEDAVADWYLFACERLERAGLWQYEISNFSCAGAESRHNCKYWTGQPYLGFGLDAHTMLHSLRGSHDHAVRWANPEELDAYSGRELLALGASATEPQAFSQTFRQTFRRITELITPQSALEEALFLGLRLVAGVGVPGLIERFGAAPVGDLLAAVPEIVDAGLVQFDGERLKLTARGRLASNEVFSRLLASPV